MKSPENDDKISSSFRDPSGHLFQQDSVLYRSINTVYKEHYDLLLKSGLYSRLVYSGFLVPHEEVEIPGHVAVHAYKVIRPEIIHFISYPYEWCFSQFKDAALLTLKIQKLALDAGMSLKDSSAYNIQFSKGKPVLIDTLSFEKYSEGLPWVAYRQFCQHFLAPLVLMSYKDIRLSQLLRIFIDGIPLDLASSLLPTRTQLSLPLAMHIHLHAKSQAYYGGRRTDVSRLKLSRNGMYGIIEQLADVVKDLDWKPHGTEWAAYYNDNSYSNVAFEHKKEIVSGFLDKISRGSVWDLGANRGIFSRIASGRAVDVISFDIDPAAVELNYLDCVKKGEENILPLLIDLSNPSPSLGWRNRERMSLEERGPAGTVMALALVHHLAISNNLPFAIIARFFQCICAWLIVEFVPKSDSQVIRMLSTRNDIFTEYDRESFEKHFSTYFIIKASMQIKDSERIIYLMRSLA